MRLIISGLLCLCASSVDAQSVYRCEDAQGHRLFADQPCHRLGALALPSETDPAADPPSLDELRAATIESAPEPEPELPPPEADGCPGSDPDALAAALASAIERKNENAMAGLFHWPAAGPGTVRRVFETAEFLIRSAPVEVTVLKPVQDDSWLWAGLPPPPPPRPVLEAHRPGIEGATLHRFQLIENAGCVWLLP